MPYEKVELEVEPLKKYSLYICTPCYGGASNMNFNHSVLELQKLLMRCGISHEMASMGNESLITRARNKMAAKFLESDYTHLMFIDSDIEFQPVDVLAMLHFQKPLIGGAYPMKGINWANVKKAVLANPEIDDDTLSKMGAQWTAHPFHGHSDVLPFEPLEVKELGTGFLLISREVFLELSPKTGSYAAADNEPGFPARMHAFFETGIHDDNYESEDYSFCRRWREAGGKVFLAPWVNLTHYGTYGFKGDFNLAARLLGEVG